MQVILFLVSFYCQQLIIKFNLRNVNCCSGLLFYQLRLISLLVYIKKTATGICLLLVFKMCNTILYQYVSGHF